MDSKERVCFESAFSPHPGELVCEYLDHWGWSQRDLARRTGLTPKTISEICNQKATIRPDAALKLEKAFQRPAHLWLNLQRQFDEAIARKRLREKSKEWLNWASNFPLKEMRDLRFSLRSDETDIETLLTYFGVFSPESWDAVWESYGVAFRQTRKIEKIPWSISAWIRETELLANQIELEPFDRKKVRSLIQELRLLTSQRVEDSLESVQDLCASIGVGVVWVPELPHSGISGCARWMPDNRAVIGLTFRYKTDDQMWFTLFHEIGHLLLHKNRKSFVLDNAEIDLTDHIIDPEMQKYEMEANQFAFDTLIPPDALSIFVREGVFTKESIDEFSKEIGISPGILVGRLQHDKYLEPHQGNAFKQKLDLQNAIS